LPIPEMEKGARLTIGSKATITAIQNGSAVKVFVAEDADNKLILPITTICNEKGIPVVRVVSMRELGRACGIRVGAAAAAVVNQ